MKMRGLHLFAVAVLVALGAAVDSMAGPAEMSGNEGRLPLNIGELNLPNVANPVPNMTGFGSATRDVTFLRSCTLSATFHDYINARVTLANVPGALNQHMVRVGLQEVHHLQPGEDPTYDPPVWVLFNKKSIKKPTHRQLADWLVPALQSAIAKTSDNVAQLPAAKILANRLEALQLSARLDQVYTGSSLRGAANVDKSPTLVDGRPLAKNSHEISAIPTAAKGPAAGMNPDFERLLNIILNPSWFQPKKIDQFLKDYDLEEVNRFQNLGALLVIPRSQETDLYALLLKIRKDQRVSVAAYNSPKTELLEFFKKNKAKMKSVSGIQDIVLRATTKGSFFEIQYTGQRETVTSALYHKVPEIKNYSDNTTWIKKPA